MKLVVGLGNPGRRYTGTRHNVGYRVLEELARRSDSAATTSKFEADVVEMVIGSEPTMLVAPRTWMNHSGRSVGQFVRFYKLPLEDLLVICDDINLPLSRLRLRAAGSSGGQKGLADIIRELGSEQFPRLRIGIDPPPDHVDASDYVLGRFRPGERERVEAAVREAAAGVGCWIETGIESAMNAINPAPPEPEEDPPGS